MPGLNTIRRDAKGHGKQDQPTILLVGSETDRRGASAAAIDRALAAELGSHVRLDRAADGAPRLTGSGLHISLTHDVGVTAIALSAEPVGIDITPVSGHRLDAVVAEQMFSSLENAWLARMPSPERPLGFAVLWSLKEAIIKRGGDCLDKTDLPNLDHLLGQLSLSRLAEPIRLAATTPTLAQLTPITGNKAAYCILQNRQARCALAIAG